MDLVSDVIAQDFGAMTWINHKHITNQATQYFAIRIQNITC